MLDKIKTKVSTSLAPFLLFIYSKVTVCSKSYLGKTSLRSVSAVHPKARSQKNNSRWDASWDSVWATEIPTTHKVHQVLL